MPIVRTFQCGECFHRLEVVLTAEQWDDPPPDCPACATREMNQEFKPVAIGGSVRSKAVKLAETIASEDYGVADFTAEGKQGGTPKVRYKDQGNPMQAAQVSSWGASGDVLAKAMQSGRQMRAKHGDGLDVLQSALKSGAQPDLIEVSKRNMMRVK